MSIKGLEDSFFAKEDEELVRKLRAQKERSEQKKTLSEASGITDDDLLEQMVKEDVSSETLVAFSLVPLVAVAWADDVMEDKERDAILQAAEESGITKSCPSYKLLAKWLQQKPEPVMMEAWKEYVGTLSQAIGADAKNQVKDQIVGRSKKVAEAAGGFLGLGSKTSSAEQKVLDELEAAFG